MYKSECTEVDITLLSYSASVCTQQPPGVRGMVQSLPDHLGHAPLSHHGVQDCVPAHLRCVTTQRVLRTPPFTLTDQINSTALMMSRDLLTVPGRALETFVGDDVNTMLILNLLSGTEYSIKVIATYTTGSSDALTGRAKTRKNTHTHMHTNLL